MILLFRQQKNIEISTIDENSLKSTVDSIKKKTFDDFGHNIVDLLNDKRLRKTVLQAINESIMSSKMPDNMQISIISPKAKIEKPEKPEDYRPVNNLPVFEKLLEVIVLEQLKDFLDCSNILTNVQHGFRSCHSTETAVISLIDNVVQHHENNKIVITIFLDFKRAFETVNREILLDLSVLKLFVIFQL